MKKLVFILLSVVILGSISCKKSNNTPDTDVIYTVKYLVASIDSVKVDTIKYFNVDGNEITIADQNNFDHSFESKNGYNAYLYVSGKVYDGKCSYSVTILNGTSIVAIEENSTSSTSTSHFTWWKKFLFSSK